jgi:hypothetical protein
MAPDQLVISPWSAEQSVQPATSHLLPYHDPWPYWIFIAHLSDVYRNVDLRNRLTSAKCHWSLFRYKCLFSLGWGEIVSTWEVSHYLAYYPAMDDGWWWWNDWQGKPKYLEKIRPQCSFLHHKFPHNLAWDRTWATAVGSRRETAWATTRPKWKTFSDLY